jgi:hypothetical protein
MGRSQDLAKPQLKHIENLKDYIRNMNPSSTLFPQGSAYSYDGF